MESLDGVAELHMSGSRAVFAPAPGSELSEQMIADALRAEGLGLTSLDSIERIDPAKIYRIDAGVT